MEGENEYKEKTDFDGYYNTIFMLLPLLLCII